MMKLRYSVAIALELALLAVACGFTASFDPSSLTALTGLMLANAPIAMPELKGLVDTIAANINGMKERQTAEVAALRKEIERVEAKSNRAGLGDGLMLETAQANASLGLRTQEAFTRHYAKKSGDEDLQGLTFGDFVRGAANLNTSAVARKALSIGTDTTGGYAVPSMLMPDILAALVPQSALLSAGAGIIPMDEGAKTYTTAAVNAIPTAAWRLENGAVAESDPTFRAVVAAPKSLSFFFKLSRELLADAPNLENALRFAMAQSFSKALDSAGLRGSGTDPTPRGLLNVAGIQTVANGANGTALASYANFFSAAQAVLQVDGPMPTAAIMSPRSRVKLGSLLDTTNQPLNVPPMLQQMLQLSTSQVPNNLTVGSSTDCSEIYVGDFSLVSFIMRESVSIQPLSELFAGNGQIAFVGHVRADVAAWYPQAIALITGVRP
jgi:HK97 family phage major capsid protein